MIDLRNTYIENLEGELKGIYAEECKKQGIQLMSDNTLEQRSSYLVVFHGDLCCLDCHHNGKELTLADLKPRVKVEYEKVEFERLSDAAVSVDAGDIYWYDGGKQSVDSKGLARHYYSTGELVFYRKVEREVSWL